MMLKTTKFAKLFVVFSLLFILGFSTVATATTITNHKSFNATSQYSFVEVTVTNYGKLDISLTSMELFDTNLLLLGISPYTENYAELERFSIAITDESITLQIAYRGDVSSNSTYTTWSNAIHDNVTTYLSDAFTVTSETSSAYYSDSDNNTVYTWIMSYTVTNPWSKINSISKTYITNDFAKFIAYNSDWTFEEFVLMFSKNQYTVNATGISIIQVDGATTVFSGNGTHIFNLKNILGYSEPPQGIAYTLSVELPPDAVINQTSLETGNATRLQVSDNQILLSVSNTETIGELSFTFSYNFTSPPPEENNNENTPGEENNTSTGSDNGSSSSSIPFSDLLGGSSIYTVAGVVALAVVFSIVKYFFKQKK